MSPSTTQANPVPERRTRHSLSFRVLWGLALAGIATVGISRSAEADCQFCPYAVNQSASPGLLSSVQYPTAAECLDADTGTIIDNGYAWLALSKTGTLALTGRIKGAWHVDGATSVCFKKNSGTLELWNGDTKIFSKGGSGATTLQIDDRCYLEILAGSKSLWKAGSGGCVASTATRNNLISREHPEAAGCLPQDQAGTIIDNGTAWLNFESNGDLVAYTAKGKFWSSGTSGSSHQVCFKDGQHFQVVDGNGKEKWEADGTGDGKGQTLLFTSDCHVSVNDASGKQLWKSGKNGC